jgi:hypothetical protein
MRKLRTWLAVVGTLALVTAGVAVATHKQDRTHTDSVAATFTASQTRVHSKTCTGSDGAYRQFRSAWRGTSTGDPRLTGALRLHAHGLVNTTTDRGQVVGHVWIRGTSGKLAHAKLWGVYQAGKIHGVVVGRVKDRSTGAAEELSGSGRLIGAVEATFNAAGTELTGRIGGSGATILPATIQKGGCGSHDNGHRGDKKKGKRG